MQINLPAHPLCSPWVVQTCCASTAVLEWAYKERDGKYNTTDNYGACTETYFWSSIFFSWTNLATTESVCSKKHWYLSQIWQKFVKVCTTQSTTPTNNAVSNSNKQKPTSNSRYRTRQGTTWSLPLRRHDTQTKLEKLINFRIKCLENKMNRRVYPQRSIALIKKYNNKKREKMRPSTAQDWWEKKKMITVERKVKRSNYVDNQSQ